MRHTCGVGHLLRWHAQRREYLHMRETSCDDDRMVPQRLSPDGWADTIPPTNQERLAAA